MSKSAVDVAMVGVTVGTAAVAGVGFASPFYGLAFAIGGGVAGGTIALVSQRYGAEAYEELSLVVRSSTLLVLIISIPVSVIFWVFPHELISLLSDNSQAIAYGAEYLKIVGLAVPFAGLNLVGGRALIGADDAYTAMQVRASGALINIALNSVFIFGFGWGVTGAALGTVCSNVAVTLTFVIGITQGRFPGMGRFPIQVTPLGTYVDPATLRSLVSIGAPVGGRNLVWVVAEFPMLGILDMFGESTVAAFVIARRIWGIMNTPGWGFGLAASSLVGQSLGRNDEETAAEYGREIIQFAVATYAVSAVLIAIFADSLVLLFAESAASPEVPIAITLVYAACVAVIFQGIAGASSGALDASGDTRIPFASQTLGMFGGSIPLAYLGATTGLGYWGLYLAFIAETGVPAIINYARFRTGKWKAISKAYRPTTTVEDD